MLFSLTTFLSLAVGLSVAAPASSTSAPAHGSHVGGITLCTESDNPRPDPQGFCHDKVPELLKCYNIRDIISPSEGHLKSLIINQEGFRCFVYNDPCHDDYCDPDDQSHRGTGKCFKRITGGSKALDASNPANLKSAQSFKCYKKE
ncbi:hypothetical protein QBC43DRAFT_369247 [Cladorrhinum sp. PSN259]|nr:hypothetical protein QBC43DRAFT_369247 [Cladorrhinum sp. PSN259]